MPPEEELAASPADIISEAISGIDEVTDAEPVEVEAPADEVATESEAEPVEKVEGEEPKADEPAKESTEEDAQREEARALGLKTQAQARFVALNKTIKERDAELADLKAKGPEVEALRSKATIADEMHREIMASGLTPQNYAVMLRAAKGMNSGDPAEMKLARDFAAAQVRELDKMLGSSAEYMDPDLKGEVESGTISEARALELQQARRALALRQQQTQVRTQQDQQTQAVQQGAQAVAAFEHSISSDPAIAQKMPYVMQYFRSIKDVVAPSQWVPKLQEFYRGIPAPAMPAPTPAPAARIGNVPLRATGAGKMNAVQKDPKLAMFAALEAAGANGSR